MAQNLERGHTPDSIKTLEDIIKVDGHLSAQEKQEFLRTYAAHKQELLEDSHQRQSEIRSFILRDFGKLSEQLVGKRGIREAQRYLHLEDDGIYGPNTLQKTIEFQSRYRQLKNDGIIGPNTIRFMREKLGGSIVSGQSRSSSPDVQRTRGDILSGTKLRTSVAYLQNSLSSGERQVLIQKLGLHGTLTYQDFAQAVAKYQSEQGLVQDGIPGKNTMRSLGIMRDTEIESSNRTIRNSEALRGFEKLSSRWKVIYQEFFQLASRHERNEILSGRYPIALCDTRQSKGIILMEGRVMEFPMSFSRNRKFVKGVTQGDNALNYGMIEHFYRGIPYKRGGMKIESREAASVAPGYEEANYKWWHAAPGTGPNGLRTTIGCKGLPTRIASMLARYVNKHGKGFGYASRR